MARLNGIIELCTFKIDIKGTTIPEKMRWARIMNNSIKNATPLLRDKDLDDLRERVEALEDSARE